MNHSATPDSWYSYRQLPPTIRELADKNFQLLRNNPLHPSLRFKRIGQYHSARVGLDYRAIAHARDEGAVWFWIGGHDEYERLLQT